MQARRQYSRRVCIEVVEFKSGLSTAMRHSNLPIWKPIIAAGIQILTVKIFHRWVPEPVAWAIAGFAMVQFIYFAPPRVPLAFRKVLLLGIGTGGLLYGITKFVG